MKSESYFTHKNKQVK